MTGTNLDGATMTEHGGSSGPAAPRLGLVVLTSPDRELDGGQLTLDTPLSVGRSGATDVERVIDDPTLSRRHATFSLDAQGKLLVVDHASKNGTRIDGRRIERGTARVGAVVRIGATLLEFAELDEPEDAAADPLLMGRSFALQRMLARIAKVAPIDAAVLLVGETGTGKELVARRIHEHSGRSGELVPINCAAIPRDLAESILFGHRRGAFTGATESSPGVWGRAQDGTVFLDEVGEMPIELQPKLLRALETDAYTPVGDSDTKAAHVRVISATNANLQAAMETGDFRPDLYARLAGSMIELPPLRARRSDIMPLLRHFLAGDGQPAPQFSPAAIERLILHRWPRNIRELKNVARHVQLQARAGESVELADLPTDIVEGPAKTVEGAPPARVQESAPGVERLRELIERHQGNVAEVARALGRDRKQVYRWLKRHDIDPERYRP